LWLLVLARALQGLATAIVVTVGYALVFDKVGPDRLGQAMGFTSMALSMGWFAGPVVGGIIYEHAGYLAVFAPPLALIGLEIILRLLLVEEVKPRSDPKKRQVPEHENVHAASDEASLLLSRSEPAVRAHRNAYLTLLSSKRFVVGMLGFCILNALMVAFDGVLPVFLKERYGFDSQQVSLTFLALTVPMLLSPLFGALTDRMGSTKWPAVAGLVLCVPGLLLLRLTGNGTDGDFALLIILLAVLGVAFAIGLPPLAAEVMHVVDEMERQEPGIFGPNGACAQAYGLTNAGLGVGCLLGPMGAGFARVRWGWKTAVTCMAVASAVTAVIVLPVTGGSLRRKVNGKIRDEQSQRAEDGPV
jgi:MFS family permease